VSSVNQPPTLPSIEMPLSSYSTISLPSLSVPASEADLVRDAFHQAAVADEGIGVVIDQRVAGAVEALRQHLLCQRHADRIASPWPSGPVVVSTPGVSCTSGWPGVFECNWRKA
jgi:hypothetical protein